MKKIFYFSLLFIMLIPLKISAANTYIDDYYIDITIKENGDALVKELFTYKGKFNGAFKTLSYDTAYSGNSNSFVDESLYSPLGIELLEIKEIKVDHNINFDYLYHEGTPFTRNDSAAVGSSGYYSVTQNYKQYTYKIFNPGTYKGFYIEYILKDVVINHQDVSEIWLNILRKNPDYIKHLEIVVNLPGNKEILRSWSHGLLTGTIDIVDSEKVLFTVDDVIEKSDVDVRLAFDNYIDSSKKTDVLALDKIVDYETILAEKANAEREENRKILEAYEKKEKRKALIFNCLGCLWLLGLPFLVKFIYKNYDKEYISGFKGKYFRDIPNDNNPALVGYLVNKKVSTEDLSATILNLINKKKIDFTKVDKNDYQFSLVDSTDLDEMESLVIDLVFDGKTEQKLSAFKKKAKSGYNEFLLKYNLWNGRALRKANEKNYFESKVWVKSISIFYSLLGLCLLVLLNTYVNKIIAILIIILGFISLIYFSSYTKRTREGNEEYLKWIGLKNFMNDFGKMDIKELPEVRLWDKYLVYAVTLGCASKLAKTMKIKIQEINDTNMLNIVQTSNFTNHLFLITDMNRAITSSVNSAVSSAKSIETSKSISSSPNSSGGGYGGGFSSGGGFSGGGGGSTGHF